jgi:hypothetical protein
VTGKINRHSVGLAMIAGSKNSFSRGHGLHRPRKEVQNSNGKRQMANVPGPLRRPLPPSPVRRVKVPPHLPFDLCHLPFGQFVPEKKFKIQTAKGNE